MSNVTPLKTLEAQAEQAAAEWIAAKLDEKNANARRLAAEKILCALNAVPNSGEGTVNAAHGKYSVKISYKLNRKLDASMLLGMDKKIPEAILRRLVEYRPSLVLSELRYIEENEPQYFKAFCDALTVEPAKPSVTVEIK